MSTATTPGDRAPDSPRGYFNSPREVLRHSYPMGADRDGGRSRGALAAHQDEAPGNDPAEPGYTDRAVTGLPVSETDGMEEAIPRGTEPAGYQRRTQHQVSRRRHSCVLYLRRLLLLRRLLPRHVRDARVQVPRNPRRPNGQNHQPDQTDSQYPHSSSPQVSFGEP